MVWTRFMDMSSGGGRKEDFSKCYIEASEEEAKIIFYNRFGHNPERVTCTCCGDDYSITEEETLEQATAYDRGCAYGKGGYVERGDPKRTYQRYIPLADFIAGGIDANGMMGREEKVHFIYAADIKPEERVGAVPQQGYVWQ